MKEQPSARDLSYDTEKIEDEPQPNFLDFDWIRPIDQSSKQWYEQQDGSNVVWHACSYSSKEQDPFSARSVATKCGSERQNQL